MTANARGTRAKIYKYVNDVMSGIVQEYHVFQFAAWGALHTPTSGSIYAGGRVDTAYDAVFVPTSWQDVPDSGVVVVKGRVYRIVNIVPKPETGQQMVQLVRVKVDVVTLLQADGNYEQVGG